jgi:hypothetical protein
MISFKNYYEKEHQKDNLKILFLCFFLYLVKNVQLRYITQNTVI